MFVSLFSANLAYVRPFYYMSVSPLPSFPCLFLLTSLWMVYSSTDFLISCTRFVTNIEFFNFILKYFLVLLKNYCVTFIVYSFMLGFMSLFESQHLKIMDLSFCMDIFLIFFFYWFLLDLVFLVILWLCDRHCIWKIISGNSLESSFLQCGMFYHCIKKNRFLVLFAIDIP